MGSSVCTDQEVRCRPPASGHPGETGQLTSDTTVLMNSSEHSSHNAFHTTISCNYFYETVLCSDPSSGSRHLPPQLCLTAHSPISQELPLTVGTVLPKVTFSLPVSTRVNLPISVCFRLQAKTAAFIQLPANSKGVHIMFYSNSVASNIC